MKIFVLRSFCVAYIAYTIVTAMMFLHFIQSREPVVDIKSFTIKEIAPGGADGSI